MLARPEEGCWAHGFRLSSSRCLVVVSLREPVVRLQVLLDPDAAESGVRSSSDMLLLAMDVASWYSRSDRVALMDGMLMLSSMPGSV